MRRESQGRHFSMAPSKIELARGSWRLEAGSPSASSQTCCLHLAVGLAAVEPWMAALVLGQAIQMDPVLVLAAALEQPAARLRPCSVLRTCWMFAAPEQSTKVAALAC